MDQPTLWKEVLRRAKSQFDPAHFATFLAKTELVDIKEGIATISCPNTYSLDNNQNRNKHLLVDLLNQVSLEPLQIAFVLNTSPKSAPKAIDDTPLFQPSTIAKSQSLEHNLVPRFTFDTLVVGNSNNFAYAAAQAVVSSPGTSYNPLFIWGGVGVGKTHLMHSIGHELKSRSPDLKLRYFPAESFTNDLSQALRNKTIDRFKDKYRTLDCMIVDDIQFLSGKEYSQEEFFHTFNSLYLAGKQIILASDRKPSEIKDLQDRLVSRFAGGLTVDIQLPDYEMRVSIIKQKSEEKNIKISPEAVNFLAETNQSNIRDLEGKLQEAALVSLSKGFSQITIESLGLSPQNNQTGTNLLFHKTNPRHIISICAKTLEVKTGDLVGKSRQAHIAQARHITAYVLLSIGNLPLQEVGELLGGRDHTSIMHARDKIHNLLSTSPQISSLFHQIKSAL